MIKLKILFVEDLPADVEIAVREIRNEKISFDFEVVDTADAFRKALKEFDPDLIISDYSMPVFDGMTALNITRSQAHYIPFIMLTGSMNEETAVACLKAGADDYVLKEKIKRLPFAVKEVLERRRVEAERENAFQQLTESEEKIREIIENSRDIHYKQHLHTRELMYISPSCSTIFGYTPEEMKTIAESGSIHMFHPEDIPLIQHFRTELTDSYHAGIPKIEREFRILKKNGEIRWIHGHYTVKPDLTGAPLYVIGVLQDITDEKEIAQKLEESNRQKELILNSTAEMFAYYDLDLKVIWANQASAESVGKSPDELVGKYCYEIWQQRDKPCENCLVLKALHTREPQVGEQQTPDGRYWLLRGYPVLDDQGNVEALVELGMDITGQKRAEQKFETYVTSSPTAVFTCNTLGDYTFANPAACKLLGYPHEELLGMNINQIAHPDNFQDNLDTFPRLLQGERVHQEISMQSKSGEKIFAILDAVMLDNETIIGFCTETTERRKAEEALVTSEKTYRNLFQNAQVGLFRTRITDGKILEGNDQIATMFGYCSREEFIREYTTSGNYVDQGTRERMLEQIEKEGFVENFEARFFRKDRTILYASYSARIFTEKGWIEGVVEDVTERKKAQQALQLASENWKTTFRSMRDGIALLDVDQNILQYNEAFQSFVGKPESDIKGSKCYYQVHGTECPVEGCPYVRMKESKTRESTESQINGKDCEIIVDPILDEKGEITGAVHVLTDITQRTQMIRELIAAKEKAEESDRLKSAFLANMSHEIRTPMNGIMGFTELLKEPNLSGEDQQRFIEIIRKSGDRLLNTVNDLIDISRIETGQMPVVYTETRVNLLLEGLISFFQPQARQKGLQLRLDTILPSGEAIIITDQGKLNSILTNLIKNAIKYTETGKIEVDCMAQGILLKFSVKDTGIGVPENRREAIFNRFEQADIADTRAFQGSGLGLSIAKAYVEMLGGTIGLDSKVGFGSTFWFTLPNNMTPEYRGEESQKTNGSPSQVLKQPANKIKILVAEDDEDSYFLIESALKEPSYELIWTTTGTETIELCKQHPDLDIILMDIKMPIMDGFKATRKIREFNKKVIIIAQTAYALSGDREKALAAGCNDYLAKPVNMGRLIALVNEKMAVLKRSLSV